MDKLKPKLSMRGELYRITTSDGLELHGFLSPAENSPTATAVCHVHGLDGNFYENRFLDEAARVYNRAGADFLTGNNRGHDYIADILRPGRGDYVQLGGVYERMRDCVKDISAWVDFLWRRGARHVVLQGHSHGAIKVVHYLVKTEDPRVRALVLLSPSDDMGLARKMLKSRFASVLARARRLVRDDRGRELMRQKDFPYPISARSFVDFLDPRSVTGMFNLSRTDRRSFPELALVRVPVFCAVGTVREAFTLKPTVFLKTLQELLVRCPSFVGTVVTGAPHNYLGREKELACNLERWLKRQKAFSLAAGNEQKSGE